VRPLPFARIVAQRADGNIEEQARVDKATLRRPPLWLRPGLAAMGALSLAGKRVADGAAHVELSDETMRETVDRIGTVSGLMIEIAHASPDQDGAIRQVGDAMVQMDRSTRQNAALVEDASAAAQTMDEQSRRLLASTAHFRSGQAERPAVAA
jgi:hypothetical protein